MVSGRVAYIAALWTSPIAWNRVPLIGNVRLEVVTARMVQQPPVSSAPRRAGAVGESLLVRWRTIGKSSNWGLPFVYSGTGRRDAAQNKQEAYFTAAEPRGLTGRAGADAGNEFTGLFIFEFDGEGRILSHTIEHVQEGGQWEQGVGAKVVGLTDWLLGGMKGDSEGPLPAHFSRLRSRALVDAKLGRITTRRRFPLCGGPGR